MWVLGVELDPLQEEQMLLTIEATLQPVCEFEYTTKTHDLHH